MIRAVFFDLDGTLIDSEPLHRDAFNAALKPRGIVIESDDYFMRLIGLNDHDCFATVLREHDGSGNESEIAELMATKHDILTELIETRDLLYPGAAEFVHKCGERFPLIVVTGALRSEAEQTLRLSRLRDHFLDIIAAEDVEQGKPAPDGFLAALGRIGFLLRQRDPVMPEQTLVIEDTAAGIEAAHRAGMKVLAVCNTASAEALGAAELVRPSLLETDLDDVLRRLSRKEGQSS